MVSRGVPVYLLVYAGTHFASPQRDCPTDLTRIVHGYASQY